MVFFTRGKYATFEKYFCGFPVSGKRCSGGGVAAGGNVLDVGVLEEGRVFEAVAEEAVEGDVGWMEGRVSMNRLYGIVGGWFTEMGFVLSCGKGKADPLWG
jgi:hypothetical protein